MKDVRWARKLLRQISQPIIIHIIMKVDTIHIGICNMQNYFALQLERIKPLNCCKKVV